MGRCVLVRAWVHGFMLKIGRTDSFHRSCGGVQDDLRLARKGWVMEVRHIFREGNHYADHLANLAHEGTNGLVRLPNPPDSLLPSLHADALRHGKLRF
ncbi:hypothetical protein Goshw_015999 [Gossypium schwendimanii]|uniref:RNase H type-1 domain-containing protein n=1 Tax=Gossypium schwendimanii TaxID=34291 RepID=A0A7J9MQA8_GOSSC|nr:hypothetical protein [Gossypium schwendimanii]